MDPRIAALVYASIAGASIVLGGFAGLLFRRASESALVFLVALGGGALLGAVALVLLPEGIRILPPVVAGILFATGGVLFMLLDAATERAGGSIAQFLAMLLDAVPESLALGATVAVGGAGGVLLVILVSIQNAPEGFNALRELVKGGRSRRVAMLFLSGVALLNPIGAAVGYVALPSRPWLLATVMLVSAGGITYLLFHDIAPKAHKEGHWIPTLGAILGFAIGIFGLALL